MAPRVYSRSLNSPHTLLPGESELDQGCERERGFGTRPVRTALERSTTPTLSRRTCSHWYRLERLGVGGKTAA
jgi:hypothetical protein